MDDNQSHFAYLYVLNSILSLYVSLLIQKNFIIILPIELSRLEARDAEFILTLILRAISSQTLISCLFGG